MPIIVTVIIGIIGGLLLIIGFFLRNEIVARRSLSIQFEGLKTAFNDKLDELIEKYEMKTNELIKSNQLKIDELIKVNRLEILELQKTINADRDKITTLEKFIEKLKTIHPMNHPGQIL